jgi:hypothetical protein
MFPNTRFELREQQAATNQRWHRFLAHVCEVRIGGNMDLFINELRAVLDIPEPKNPKNDIIRHRVGGTMEIDGNRDREVKQWLAVLGF